MAENSTKQTKTTKTTKQVEQTVVPQGQMEIPYVTEEMKTSTGKCCDGNCKCEKMKESYTKLVKHILNSSNVGRGLLLGGIQINVLPKTGEYLINSKTVMSYDGLVEYLTNQWMSI